LSIRVCLSFTQNNLGVSAGLFLLNSVSQSPPPYYDVFYEKIKTTHQCNKITCYRSQ